MTFHREVNLIVKNNVRSLMIWNFHDHTINALLTNHSMWKYPQIFCTAIGSIELYSEECKKAVEERNIGVGQLFRFLGILPSFKLLTAGRNDQGALYREYELSCPQIRCRFVETFSLDFLEPLEQFETVYGVSLPPPTAQNTHRSNINDALTETGTAINGKVEW